MGSKYRLLPWIFDVLGQLEFKTAVDAFSGSGCVAYLLKSMGKRTVANDFLNFCSTLSRATVENSSAKVSKVDISRLLAERGAHGDLISRTFEGIFYTSEDLRFLDRVCANIASLGNPYKRALAMSALLRACVKRQPRGVFTVAGDPARYKDGRRDLELSLLDHFVEQIEVYNGAVFENGQQNAALRADVFAIPAKGVDLVYLDPPYVPRADDNCYVKRYHFLEGLSCYWDGLEILEDSKVRKIRKPVTPFSYRREALEAFDRLFAHFSASTIVLSYSSNGYPDLDVLLSLMRRHKPEIRVHERSHRYHFGTHDAVRRARVQEYLVVGIGSVLNS
jgi:adenine-specific DNA-methyltransferase